MAHAVKAKYAKHYGPYLGMDYSFCAFGTGTHGGLEPDACRLLRHLAYARTTLDFQERGLDGAGRDVDEYKRATARTFRHILMISDFVFVYGHLIIVTPDGPHFRSTFLPRLPLAMVVLF